MYHRLRFAGVIEIYTRPTPLAMATKIGNFNTKLARTRLIQEIGPRMLHQTGFFRGHAIYRCHWNLHHTDASCHGNENLGILTQNWLECDAANIKDRAKHVAPNRWFSRSGNLTPTLKFTSDRPVLPR